MIALTATAAICFLLGMTFAKWMNPKSINDTLNQLAVENDHLRAKIVKMTPKRGDDGRFVGKS